MLQNNFLPYKQSLDLKELGFDELCFAYFRKPSDEHFQMFDKRGFTGSNQTAQRHYVKAPLITQALEYLDTVHQIRVEAFTSPTIGKHLVQLYVRDNTDSDNIGERVSLIGKGGFTKNESLINGIKEAIKLLTK